MTTPSNGAVGSSLETIPQAVANPVDEETAVAAPASETKSPGPATAPSAEGEEKHENLPLHGVIQVEPSTPFEEARPHPASGNGKRRFTWYPLALLKRSPRKVAKPQLTKPEEHHKKQQAVVDHAIREQKLSRSDRRARQSAEVVKSLIIGSPSIPSPSAKGKPISKRKVEKVKSELINTRSANKIISQLRLMTPANDPPTLFTIPDGQQTIPLSSRPIHAVCFAYPDCDAHEKHFSKLGEQPNNEVATAGLSITSVVSSVTSVTNASLAQLNSLISELRIVSLIASPDLGFGLPGDAPGLLSGSVPTAETVLRGVEAITPQLMALGYATGRAIVPDHTGVYPPKDRMSVITYWWGFEVTLPPPSIKYLSSVPSVANAIVNFLTGLSLVNGGVREILPFIRYISQFIDTQFKLIKDSDRGMGVVCAATWLMPIALVPRPWDFPDPPQGDDTTPQQGDTETQPDNMPIIPPASSSPSSSLSPISDRSPVLILRKAVPPIDDTPVDIDGVADEHVPEVKVTPPTPPITEVLC